MYSEKMASSMGYANGSMENASMWIPNGSQADDQDSGGISSCLETLKTTRFVVQLILVPLVSAFGVIGNILNVVVLTKRWMRSSTNYYLTALAMYDILYLTFMVTLTFKYYPEINSLESFIYFRDPWGRPLTNIASNTAVWLTVTFTVERYIAVCYPMRGKVLCTPQRARWIILAVCLSAFAFTFPEFFSRQVVEEWNTETNITTLKAAKTDFAKGMAFEVGYTWTVAALFTFGPLVLLSIFNSFLVQSVWKATQLRKAMAGGTTGDSRQDRHTKEQQRITVMLISVVIVFLICQMPSAITLVWMSTVTASRDLTPSEGCTLRISGNILNLLVQLNSTTNFILYSYFSSKFRKTFKRVFCQCFGKNDKPENIFSDIHMSKIQHGSKTNLVVSTNANANSRSVTPRGSGISLETNGNNKKNKNGYLKVPQVNERKVAV